MSGSGKAGVRERAPRGVVVRVVSALFLSQLWMGLSAAAYVYMNAGLLGRALPLGVYWLAAWGTWLVYVLDSMGGHSEEDRINRPKRTAFFEKHGTKAIIMARFVPFVRTFVPFAAGVSEMNYKKYL